MSLSCPPLCLYCSPQRRSGGAITISGAVGGTSNRATRLNGTFEMTTEVCNGMPMYQKQGDPDTWLSMCKTKTGSWRWYIKPAKEKGPDSSVCFGYGISSDVVFPQECDAKCWYCYDGTSFQKEARIVVALVAGAVMPTEVFAMRATRQEQWAEERRDKTTEVCALALPTPFHFLLPSISPLFVSKQIILCFLNLMLCVLC